MIMMWEGLRCGKAWRSRFGYGGNFCGWDGIRYKLGFSQNSHMIFFCYTDVIQILNPRPYFFKEYTASRRFEVI